MGKENFEIEILEDGIPDEQLNNKEIYYINKYDSFKNGFNRSVGGGCSYNSILNSVSAKEIQTMLLDSNIDKKDIIEKYNISSDMLSDINNGDTWYNSKLTYPLRQPTTAQRGFSKEEINTIINLLRDETYAINQISEKFNCSNTTISCINEGKTTMYRIPNVNYPIRKTYHHINLGKEEILKVAYLLKATTKTYFLIYHECLENKHPVSYERARHIIQNINKGAIEKDIISKELNIYNFPIRQQ